MSSCHFQFTDAFFYSALHFRYNYVDFSKQHKYLENTPLCGKRNRKLQMATNFNTMERILKEKSEYFPPFVNFTARTRGIPRNAGSYYLLARHDSSESDRESMRVVYSILTLRSSSSSLSVQNSLSYRLFNISSKN